MKRVEEVKVKGANLKQGKLVDNTRLEDNEKFWRGKDETDPEIKRLKQKKDGLPKNMKEFINYAESKEDEARGIY